MRVKICGITQGEQGVAIATLGASALGFICVATSPRYVPPAAIAAMLAQLRAKDLAVDTVGVFANADLDTLQTAVATAPLTTLQLHGDEPPEFCRQVRAALPQQLIKALRIRSAADLEATAAYEDGVDALLLDAYHPQMLGGTGKTLDWQALQSFQPSCPWLLAGGLTPENVATALAQLRPDGIDLSSGVEISPGIKDLSRVKALFDAL